MAIAFDSSGTTAITTAASSAVVNITSAAVGAWCYVWCAISTGSTTQTGVPSATGWTAVQSEQTTAGTSGATYAIFRRKKQSGDTTFTFNWATNPGKGAFAWASWTGVDGTTPDESSAIALNDTTQRSSVPTPSATPSAAGRWAVAFFGQRATSSILKPTSWGPDVALTDRQEADNSGAASSPWLSADIEDSNGTVTVAAHSYTSTSNASNSHDGSALLFLVPSSGTAHTATVSLTVTPSFTVARSQAHVRTVALTVTPSFTVARTRAHFRTVSLVVAPSRTVARVQAHVRAVALTVTPALSVTGQVQGAHTTTVVLIIAPVLTVHAQVTPPPATGGAYYPRHHRGRGR